MKIPTLMRHILLMSALFFLTLAYAVRPSAAASTIIVDSLDDDSRWTGTCSLRDAVTASNTNAAVDGCPAGNPRYTTIVVDPALSGGAIHIMRPMYIQDNVTIKGDIFLDGQHISQHFIVTNGASLTLENMTLQFGKSTSGGGSIRVDSGALALRTVRLRNNIANIGGAIVFNAHPTSFGRLYISNSEFRQNNADLYGGAIVAHASAVIEDTVFVNNDAPDGGAIWADADLTISGGEFIANQARDQVAGRGGAIYATGGTVNVSDTLFQANRGQSGMAVYVADAARFEMSRSDVLYSTAVFGRNSHAGAAVALLNTDGSISDSYFAANKSVADGGGLLVAGGKVGVWDSQFRNNSARNGGGVAIVAGANVLLNLDQIVGNSAENFGGGVYVLPDSSLTLPTTTVSGNRATFGGGIYADGAEIFVDSAEITNNLAYTSGGGYFGIRSNGTLQGSTLTNNNAQHMGGAFHMRGGEFAILSSSFLGNEATDGLGRGGAIWNAGDLLVQDSLLSGNKAHTGGAIFQTFDAAIDRNAFMLITHSTLNANIAFNGAGIANDGPHPANSTVVLTTVQLDNNDALNGSALFNRNATTELYDTLIIDNNSNAINNSSGEVGLFASTIRNSQFANCVGPITTNPTTYPNTASDNSCQ